MGDTKTEAIAVVKLLLGLRDNNSDAVIGLIIDEVTDAVLSYCHIKVMPRQLEGFIPFIAARRFNENAAGGIKSITEGDRRIEYGDTKTDYLSEYAERLRPFVSRAAFVPSDLDEEGQ